MKITKTKLIIRLGIVFLAGLTIFAIWLFLPYFLILSGDLSCVVKTEERITRGDSLSGLIEEGTTIKIFFGYYDCNEIELNDVIAYDYAGNPEPIIKIIKALPGDTFYLKQEGRDWRIVVNDIVLKNSKGEPYILDEHRHRMLSLYERDYKGVIPDGAYLILGNLPTGTLDSTRFGLVSKIDILGKVIIP